MQDAVQISFAWGLVPLLLVILWTMLRSERGPRLARLRVNGELARDSRIVRASRFATRSVGLLNHAYLLPAHGLWLKSRGAVHTRGMLFPIDLVQLDAAGTVLGVTEHVPAGELIRPVRGTRSVLELRSGGAREDFAIRVGDRLTFEV